jgi:hypothetical protein
MAGNNNKRLVPEKQAQIAGLMVAAFSGSHDFADFNIGNDEAGCYRYDVAVNLMSGRSCRSVTRGGKAGAIEPRCGQPRRIKEDPRQSAGREEHVGTIQEDK